MLAQVLQRWWVKIPLKSEWNYSVKSVLHSTEPATSNYFTRKNLAVYHRI